MHLYFYKKIIEKFIKKKKLIFILLTRYYIFSIKLKCALYAIMIILKILQI